MKTILHIILIISLAQAAIAQSRSLPRFEKYPALSKFRGKPAPTKLSSPRARMYRTVIRNGAKEGPNFAGHYTIVVWGCGMNCMQLAIVDARTGEVYFPPNLMQVNFLFENTEEPLQFQTNSRLLIVLGTMVGTGDDWRTGRYYYEWKNNRLKLVHAIERK